MTLTEEVKRVGKGMSMVLAQSGYAGEVPYRIHERGTDEGHGLGGPAFAPEFIRFLALDRDEQGGPGRFRPSAHRVHRNRLQRALRSLRAISPQEYDAVYLIVARGLTWAEAKAKINAGREARGQKHYSDHAFLVLTILGFDILTEMF